MSTVANHLDALPIRRAHWRMGLSAGLGLFLDGYDSAMTSILLIYIRPAWHLGPAALGMLGASMLVGALLGGAVGGRIADRFGRKKMYLLDIATFLIASLLSATSWNVASLVAFRFMVGIGIGIDYPLSATYLAEFAPRVSRGAMMTWTFALLGIGSMALLVVALLLAPLGENSWRIMLATGAIPALALLALRRTLPESPRWHAKHQRMNLAVKELQRFDPSLSSADASALLASATSEESPSRHWRELFSKRYLLRTALISVPWFIMDIYFYGFGVYLPTLLIAFGMKSFTGTIASTLALGAFSTVFLPLLAFNIDRMGRIRPQVIGFVGMGVGMLALGIFALSGSPSIPIAFACLLAMRFFEIGPNSTTWILPVELFPTELRASAHGFATSFSRLGAASSVFLFPILRESIGTAAVLILVAVMQLLAAGITVWLAHEPAQLSLEEIAA